MKKYLNEIFLLRAVAATAVVLLHSIYMSLENFKGDISSTAYFLSSGICTFLYFGTPTFVLISEIVIANSYKDNIPKGFFSKRLKYIFVPYMIMGIVYALLEIKLNDISFSLSTIIIESLKNIIFGDFHGYFVLIIFQFYILHALLHNVIKKYNPVVVLSVSFIINVAYLAFFRITSPMDIPFGEYIWQRYHWMPFVGWIFYFFAGYYIGTNYSKFIYLLKKYKKTVISFLVTSIAIVFGLTILDIFPMTSKRPDMVIYTIGVLFVVVLLSSYLKRVPKIFILISQYSYGIYLLHMMFLQIINTYTKFPFVANIAVSFIGAMTFSITIIYSINKFRFGKYIVGKIGISPYQHKKQKKESLMAKGA